MFNSFREFQFEKYVQARNFLIQNFHILTELEEFMMSMIYDSVYEYLADITQDYDEASYLYPFWQNYPPDERGRQPVGDQFPWIEVGEHALGCKLPRILDTKFHLRDTGLPTGPDQRFLVSNSKITEITQGLTESCWLFIDIKSVGPRDDFDHAVMSHNQVSGSGKWESVDAGIQNNVVLATGKKSSHAFHCSIPPIYVLSDGTVAPVVIVVLKPVYRMLRLENPSSDGGQPLGRVTFAAIPNGLLLNEGPHYLREYPSLLFPGKDDKSKNPLKVRCRVSFHYLRKINPWRVREIDISRL